MATTLVQQHDDSTGGLDSFLEAALAEIEPLRCLPSGAGGVLPKSQVPQPKKETPQQIKMRRMLSNRASAKASRERSREFAADLVFKKQELVTRNAALIKANAKLRIEVRDLTAKVKAMIELNTSRQENQHAMQRLQEQEKALAELKAARRERQQAAQLLQEPVGHLLEHRPFPENNTPLPISTQNLDRLRGEYSPGRDKDIPFQDLIAPSASLWDMHRKLGKRLKTVNAMRRTLDRSSSQCANSCTGYEPNFLTTF